MAVSGLEILKVQNQSGIICRCLIIKVQTKDFISNWDSVCNQSWPVCQVCSVSLGKWDKS